MDFNVPVAEMYPGMDVEGFYLINNIANKTSSANKPFLAATISDNTGIVDVKMWDYTGPLSPEDNGKVVKLRGNISDFRGALQLIAGKMRIALETDSYELSRLVPTTELDVNKAYEEIMAIVDKLPDEDYKAVCHAMMDRYKEEFTRIPAAKSVHHAFIGGLFQHTYNMLRAAKLYAGLYSDVVDKSLLITGTLLHDIAKTREFLFSDLGLVTDYSVKGELLGHLYMGACEIQNVCAELNIPEEKSVLLAHMLLSHHGQPEYGAAVRPMLIESELLYCLDKTDSRMQIYREELKKLQKGAFSEKVFALDKKIYNHE